MANGRILIIDDDPHAREAMGLALKGAGYTVETAADGAAGLDTFRSGGHWDLVLLDQRMPGMEGLEVLQRLHEFDGSVPVFLLTAYGSVELTGDALGSGARGFLTKPISVGELRDVVATALRQAGRRTHA